MGIYRNFFEQKLSRVISNARRIYYTGWGEVLLLPEIGEFLDYLNQHSPDTEKYFTTNGSPLTDDVIAKLFEGKYVLQISLHAADALLHSVLTRSNKFDQIEQQLRKIMKIRKERNLEFPFVALIFVINTLNIEHLPDYVDFAGSLGVNEVICQYMTAYNAEHVKLSCYFMRDTTNRMFDLAQERAQKLNLRLVLPPRFGVSPQKQDPGPCKEPWTHLLVNTNGDILPCCYAGSPIGNLKNQDFMSIWNGAAYVELRRSLLEHRPSAGCMNCLRFASINVNDIRSHITNRDVQREILESLGREE
jgi:radical SAM protein with 4Fe4S-binding SPASM domain